MQMLNTIVKSHANENHTAFDTATMVTFFSVSM